MTELSVRINAAPGLVWRHLADVERWPAWNPSVTRVDTLEPGELRVGQRVRIKQPRMPTMVWHITDLDPPRSYSWRATRTGLTTTGRHEIAPSSAGASDVTLSISWRGALAPLVRLLYGRRTRRYIEQEAHGLKRRSEMDNRDGSRRRNVGGSDQ